MKYSDNVYATDQDAVSDMLIIMGGPMGVNDIVKYPWLIREKCFEKCRFSC
jgi:GMP synthase-like glutamine amidotransferase